MALSVGRDDRRTRGGFGVALLVAALAYLAGTAVGKLFGAMVGSGLLRDFFANGHRLGTRQKPISLDLGFVDFTLGFNFDLNFFALLFMVAALFFYKRT